MTEDDTFRRLRRPTYGDMRERLIVLAHASIASGGYGNTNYLTDRRKLLEEHHWTESEYDAFAARRTLMTEEDTFLKLKQRPLPEVIDIIYQPAYNLIGADAWKIRRDKLLSDNGHSFNEYLIALRKHTSQ